MNKPALSSSSAPLSAIVFDMDGTLLDTATSVPRAVVETVRELGGREVGFDDVSAVEGAGTVEGTLAALLDRPVTAADKAVYFRNVEAALSDLRAYDGVAEVLAVLATRLPLAVYTGASRRSAELALQHSGLAAHLRALVGGDEVRSAKPHPEGIHRACELLGVEPGLVAYVGDAPTDLLAAKAGGVLAVAVTWGRLYDPGAPADLTLSTPAELMSLVNPPAQPARHDGRPVTPAGR